MPVQLVAETSQFFRRTAVLGAGRLPHKARICMTRANSSIGSNENVNIELQGGDRPSEVSQQLGEHPLKAKVQAQIAAVELEVQQAKHDAIRANMRFLAYYMRLHMSGIIEYGAHILARETSLEAVKASSRNKQWVLILEHHQEFRERLCKHCPDAIRQKCASQDVAKCIMDMYDRLEDDWKYQQSKDTIDIVAGPVTRQEMLMLQCIAEAAMISYNMHPVSESTTINKNSKPAGDGALIR